MIHPGSSSFITLPSYILALSLPLNLTAESWIESGFNSTFCRWVKEMNKSEKRRRKMNFIISKQYNENGEKEVGASRVEDNLRNLQEAQKLLKSWDRGEETAIAIISMEDSDAVRALESLSNISPEYEDSIEQTLERLVVFAFLEGVKAKKRGRV